ncbi:hypothetical protein ElyMa_006971600 [Elysia marginata]|uniref:Uncharacterized protein n=1 Tax=Elysia marginata TaxID=1093978 RepID=A0AAV4JRM3_9GAST|nr:hypothetical protein ElyMa_006971600 [Elysia marginata]
MTAAGAMWSDGTCPCWVQKSTTNAFKPTNACGTSSVCRSKPLRQRQSNNKLKALRSKPAAVHKPFHHTIEHLRGTRYVTFSVEVDTVQRFLV